MKVSDIMTSQVVTAKPSDSIQAVACQMRDADIGSVPIFEDGKLVGLVTDRDLVVRMLAEGADANRTVAEAMSEDVQTCKEEDTLADAAAKMGNRQLRRLVVLNDSGALVGILSLGDVASDYGAKQVGHTLEEISAETH